MAKIGKDCGRRVNGGSRGRAVAGKGKERRGEKRQGKGVTEVVICIVHDPRERIA